MQQLNAYLFFDGNCADAMHFYERVLGGKIEMMMKHAQSPVADQAPAGSADRILHAALRLGDQMLLASDAMAGQAYEGMKGFSVSFSCPAAAEAKRVFDLLAEGGQVTMPMDRTFWAEAFGMLVDRFGTPWIINGGMTRADSTLAPEGTRP